MGKITRKESRALRDIVRALRKKWQTAESLNELAEIRESFFSLPYDYESLEKSWDYVDGSKKEVVIRKVDLPMEEIVDMHECGFSNHKIALVLSTSFHTIKSRLDEYYGGRNNC